MKKLFSCFMLLAVVLCVSLFFSCSNVNPLPPQQDNYCVYTDMQRCYEANSQTNCPAGGELSPFCPFDNQSSTSSNSSPSSEPNNPDNYSYYCIYEATQQCFATSSPNCPGGGELSSFCPPFGNPSSTSSPSSPSGEPNEPNYGYHCVYTELKQCFAANSQTICPAGGELSSSCPFGNTNSSASGGNSSSGNQQANNSSSSYAATVSSSSINTPLSSSNTNVAGVSPVAYYGKLQASGNKIVGSKTGSTAVQVRGVSLGWSNTGWESAGFFNAATVNAMVDGWKAEIIRVPMGYAASGVGEYNGSYLYDKSGNMSRVKAAINAAIAKDIYVIIDWHTHTFNATDASAYFEEMASTYGSYPNVIFEIFNEPLEVSWSSIRTYATTVISAIRKYSSNLILVGTPKWDQEVDSALDNPLADGNIAYVLHFYAASHPLNGGSYTPNFASKINAVRSAGYPVFVSEYGTVSADGNGSHNETASNTWMTFLNNNSISYCAWHVNNKSEGSAFFKPSFSPSASAAWTNTSNMTTSGQYIYSNLVSWSSNAPWRGGGYIVTSSSSAGSAVVSSSSGVSATRCKDDQGRAYFCEWDTGCFAIDPTYAKPSGQTCSALISECNKYGYLYVNSTREGDNLTCNGTRVTTTSSYKYCLDYDYSECILMSTLSSYGYTCSDLMGTLSNSCPSGWDIW